MKPAWRALYDTLTVRYKSTSEDIHSAYLRPDEAISFSFAKMKEANASVRATSSGYAVEIASVFPYLLDGLFYRLLSDPEVMPWMDANSPDTEQLDLQFVASPSTLTEETFQTARLSPPRRHIADFMGQFCMNFLFNHEVGHILSGHLEALRHDGQTGEISELNVVKHAGEVLLPVRQYWEVDADLIGAALLRAQIDELIRLALNAERGSMTRFVFGPPEVAAEHCISLVTVALYCMFRYLGETRKRLHMHSDHPDPLVRAFILRNAIVPAAQSRTTINPDLFDDVFSARFEEFDDALERIGIHAAPTQSDAGIEEINDAVSDLLHRRRLYDDKARRFSRIPWPER